MKKDTIAIVGLGYVGLPIALLAKEKGYEVVGYDKNQAKVDAINDGTLSLSDKQIADNLKKYPIKASTDPAIVASAVAIINAVDTPVTHDNLPDLEPLKSSTESILPHLKGGQLLIVESTINPGVMDEVVLPILRKRSDLKLDADSYSADALVVLHCPERINPGDQKWSVRNIPRVIGGYSKEGVEAGKALYESILEATVTPMNTIMEAEACKILENTFRDINIAFINEMAKSFAKLDIDITNVIKGASTKPFAFMPHFPGNGVGGHCISVDPYYMIEKGRQAGFDHEFLKLARHINDSMPAYTVGLLEEGWQKLGETNKPALGEARPSDGRPKVAMLGLAYKKDIDDLRESPALDVLALLQEKGFEVSVFDSYVAEKSTVASLEEALKGADVIMLATNHTQFTKALTPEAIKAAGIKLVIDGKNSLDGEGIAKQGIPYYGVGKKQLPK
ncbi:MAG: nucleotide sugar dehydrogenase [Candidatus Andersenbacteria bacterium]|nr:nucleotide sugar dehydrogenase [Candidatus Andersenbacteria bacterium]